MGRLLLLGTLVAGFGLAGCAARDDAAEPPETTQYRAPESRPTEHETALLAIHGLGEIRVELLADHAPETVANFKKLAGEGFYDGTTFHRVMPGFMIQGGDPNTKNRDPRDDGLGGPGYKIADEFSDLDHVRGVVAMANSGRNSAGSQFFIVLEPSPHLNGYFTIFGVVTNGMEVADAVAKVEVDKYGRHGPRSRPLTNVVLDGVRIRPPGV